MQRITTGKLLIYGLLVFIFGLSSFSVTEASQLTLKKHQAGLRLGVWSHQGGVIPASDTAGTFRTNINKESFFLEGYYGYRIFPALVGEFSLSIVNRGSVTFEEAGTSNIGNLLVYSFLLHARCYPLVMVKSKVQPFVSIGGGIYYGRRSVQFSSNYYYAAYNEETGVNLNYSFGGGFEVQLSNSIALETGSRFMSVNFSKELMGIKDYDALAFWVGVKYLYQSEKKEQKHKRRLR